MSELNKNSSREEIRAYIDNIIQRDKPQLTQKVQKNNQIDVQQLKEEMKILVFQRFRGNGTDGTDKM